TGAAGLDGAIGATGPAGLNGLDGLDGLNGLDGLDGESVVGATEAPGDNCTYGGVAYTSATGIDYVCNGETGLTGPAGATGPQGPIGETGLQGAPGLDGAVGATGPAGVAGPTGSQGLKGDTGSQGIQGIPGAQGVAGLDGSSVTVASIPVDDFDCPFGGSEFFDGTTTAYACNGATGATGSQGIQGIPGAQGVAGEVGPQGLQGLPAPVMPFGYFYALMPGDNAATVAVGAAVAFPRDGAASGISGVSASEFILPSIGVYEVSWQVSVNEAGQLVLGLDSGSGVVELPYTVAGRATGTSQIVNQVLVTTTSASSILTVRNPVGNPAALTVTPLAGGAQPVSASLVIKQIL
ncbi:MAG: collagen-like protein, partial [Proteobacteria bacterium]|nr:collagen-like protein [Pseudomonadota bacterium]